MKGYRRNLLAEDTHQTQAVKILEAIQQTLFWGFGSGTWVPWSWIWEYSL